jgi:hypothetical protein
LHAIAAEAAQRKQTLPRRLRQRWTREDSYRQLAEECKDKRIWYPLPDGMSKTEMRAAWYFVKHLAESCPYAK